ncbi:hypothetical protein HNP46_005146 [Pseudomonas nitritireducens]|uniref:Uncharacterized protein n=1 Tax=Pseudomonas nitroreducens TaxID=46680 RepID=A0A7W7P325_PSENT|nr:hypothetical protein [Pseudomonas nitritireducens]MBB4866241.1 hypothetical protein [Pseudomonas nitritireducens]
MAPQTNDLVMQTSSAGTPSDQGPASRQVAPIETTYVNHGSHPTQYGVPSPLARAPLATLHPTDTLTATDSNHKSWLPPQSTGALPGHGLPGAPAVVEGLLPTHPLTTPVAPLDARVADGDHHLNEGAALLPPELHPKAASRDTIATTDAVFIAVAKPIRDVLQAEHPHDGQPIRHFEVQRIEEAPALPPYEIRPDDLPYPLPDSEAEQKPLRVSLDQVLSGGESELFGYSVDAEHAERRAEAADNSPYAHYQQPDIDMELLLQQLKAHSI